MRKFIHRINLSRVICDHLFSENHTDTHRISVGILIMGGGVLLTTIPTTYHVVHLFLEGGGYAIHGIGVSPIIEKFIKMAKETTNNVVEGAKEAVEYIKEEDNEPIK